VRLKGEGVKRMEWRLEVWVDLMMAWTSISKICKMEPRTTWTLPRSAFGNEGGELSRKCHC
jgi:hypothetical protein